MVGFIEELGPVVGVDPDVGGDGHVFVKVETVDEDIVEVGEDEIVVRRSWQVTLVLCLGGSLGVIALIAVAWACYSPCPVCSKSICKHRLPFNRLPLPLNLLAFANGPHWRNPTPDPVPMEIVVSPVPSTSGAVPSSSRLHLSATSPLLSDVSIPSTAIPSSSTRTSVSSAPANVAPPARGPGRPKGSRNKPLPLPVYNGPMTSEAASRMLGIISPSTSAASTVDAPSTSSSSSSSATLVAPPSSRRCRTCKSCRSRCGNCRTCKNRGLKRGCLARPPCLKAVLTSSSSSDDVYDTATEE